MAVDIGNLMIGLGVLLTTIFAILFKIKCIRKKCSSCLISEKSFDKDIENAAKIANEVASAVPKVYWGNLGETIKKTLSPREIKLAETVLETIEQIGEDSTKK
jgi:hypothetical protein